ncbi:hypothetical protein K2173_013413 [Erythroxylum novogranatense]|uniref:Polymerase nucleotidyl transferase domain-containing protein n=1 Tax=Erythroxylum novogranatense TaxID=1862640 RepID=A0AAV8S9Y9_9ROSI|nr:hypothetical protein K2173_013413 [Erythroxylum novogranatense]
MSDQSRKMRSLNALTNNLTSQSQLVDSLTAHISLYHSQSLSTTNPNSSPNSRTSILKWFASLTVHQRQAYLTTVDRKFVQVVIQMLGKLRANGYGRFIILPDLPSRDLPSLCYKKSPGLLSRTAEFNDSERLIFTSTRFFWSREGEKIEECSCSTKFLDSMTVHEELVENVDRFVEAMDKVTNGSFLRGEESELGSEWVELEWLKSKGYYSIEAFLVNRLEVSLRLAWMNCCGGKKRGVKLKDKITAAGVSANVFWRKKGCVDWWCNLNAETRRRFFTLALGKSAKALTREILNGASGFLEDEMWLLRAGGEQPMRHVYAETSNVCSQKLPIDAEFASTILRGCFPRNPVMTNVYNSLLILQDIVNLISSCQLCEYNMSKVHFTTLGSVNTISDCILRKLRGLVTIVSLDCTKLELLGEGNTKSSIKPKDKLGAGSRKKRGKNHVVKKIDSVLGTEVDKTFFEKPCKDVEFELASAERSKSVECNGMPKAPHGLEMGGDEHSQGPVLGKGRSAARRNRKARSKNKNSDVNNIFDVRTSEISVAEAPCLSSVTLDQAVEPHGASTNLVKKNVSNSSSICKASHPSHISLSSSIDEPSNGEVNVEESHKDHAVGRTEDSCDREPDSVSCKEDGKIQNEKSAANPISTDKSVRLLGVKGESVHTQDHGTENLHSNRTVTPSECLSYEWPTLAPVYFPSINSHLPPAADRLHLDVGHNWHNQIRQPFVSSVPQTRNSSLEGGCNRVLSQPLPMSLDWPPMVRSVCGLAPSMTCNYDSRFISRRLSAFQTNSNAHNSQFNAITSDDDRRCSGDSLDFPEASNGQELADECESHWISEEEYEVHPVTGIDYNQYFGGGVMYWNPSDHPGTGFSRAPSLSSDDSLWAWREADMTSAVDDMVAISSSYSTNGLTSPTAASFCSPFDHLGPGHQAIGYVVPGNEVPGKVLHSSPTVADSATEEDVSGSLKGLSGDVEGTGGESLPYPILRPIIIPNMSRERSRADVKHNHDHKSPNIPHSRREQSRIKRPPSPVVLCVPRAPRPPPHSSVSDSRKHRGFPTVRSGSSSPRHWGMRGWFQDGANLEDACVHMDGSEVVWPSWRNKNLSTHSMIQPLSGALLPDHLIAISQLARDQEHPDVSFPLHPPDLQNNPTRKVSLSLLHSLLHDEIDLFYKQVAAENMARKPFINWAVRRVTRSLQVLWPRSRTNIFGSNATGLSLPTSDVDLVVCLPPVRNLEPIKEAGILEGRNGIKETCLQHAARYLANQEWVKNDSLKIVENTAIPIIMLVVEVPKDLNCSVASSNIQSPKEDAIRMVGENDNHSLSDVVNLEDNDSPKSTQINNGTTKEVKSVRIDISFKSASHTGLQTTELVKELTDQFPAAPPLALVLKQFLADRCLDQSYSGGLSSYCLVLLITRFLQHEHHLGRPISQNLGSLLMDFLYFFGNVFDPRQIRISVQGSGIYIKRERGYSIDPIHIDDPLFPTNNVGRNCFRIHQCIKAFSEAYSVLGNELESIPDEGDSSTRGSYVLLPKIVPSINSLQDA